MVWNQFSEFIVLVPHTINADSHHCKKKALKLLKIERAEVVDWEEVLESPGEPLSFKTALLVEKYEKTGGYWQTGTRDI